MMEILDQLNTRQAVLLCMGLMYVLNFIMTIAIILVLNWVSRRVLLKRINALICHLTEFGTKTH